MQGIDFEIIYIKGKYNAVEKSLSIDKSPPIYIPLHIPFQCGWKKLAMNGSGFLKTYQRIQKHLWNEERRILKICKRMSSAPKK